MDHKNRKPLLFDSNSPDAGDIDQYERRSAELRDSLASIDPEEIARNTLSHSQVIETGKTQLDFFYWNDQLSCIIPGFDIFNKETKFAISNFDRMMVLYYFSYADGSSETGDWISFSELPDGRFYNQAYQSYTSQPLLRHFGDSREDFVDAAEELGGIEYPLGNSAFVFQVFSRVKILCVLWLGDEDFPSSYRILFDSSASHYLPTDAYAILGSRLSRNLISVKSGK